MGRTFCRAGQKRQAPAQQRPRYPRVRTNLIYMSTVWVRSTDLRSAGRSSGFRLVTVPEPPSHAQPLVGHSDVRKVREPGRSQRRPRDGFAPSSLFVPSARSPTASLTRQGAL